MQRTNNFRIMDFLLIGFFLLFQNSDAAITGWIVPKITGADGVETVTTPFPENLTAGQPTGININATSDVKGNKVSYFLVSQSVPDMFTIDQSTGAVTFAKGVLDFEKTQTYLIVVRVSDTAGNGTANVTLKVENSPPAFTPTTYSKEMCDGVKAGATVATVKATDPGKSNVTYALPGTGNTNNDFAMAGATGVITVAVSKTLNMTRTKTYTLEVTASDTAKGVGTAKVSVSVEVCSGGTSAIAIAYGALLLSIIVNRL